MVREQKKGLPTKKLGAILVEAGLIDEKQPALALTEQRKTGARLGDALTELGFTSDAEISRALAEQSGLDYVDLDKSEFSREALDLIPESVARRHAVMPLRIEADELVVAMSNPTDIVAVDELQRRTVLFIQVVSAGQRQLQRAIERELDRMLTAQGLLLVKAKAKKRRASGKVDGRVVIDFCHYLAAILSAGIPLLDGLRDLQEGGHSPIAEQLEDVANHVSSGRTFSAALESQSWDLP